MFLLTGATYFPSDVSADGQGRIPSSPSLPIPTVVFVSLNNQHDITQKQSRLSLISIQVRPVSIQLPSARRRIRKNRGSTTAPIVRYERRACAVVVIEPRSPGRLWRAANRVYMGGARGQRKEQGCCLSAAARRTTALWEPHSDACHM